MRDPSSEGESPPLTGLRGGEDSEGEEDGRGRPVPWWEHSTAVAVYQRATATASADRAGRTQGAAGPQAWLPCQSSHNSNGEHATPGSGQLHELTPSSRRTAYALQANVQAMCTEVGIERVGFFTLTFADHVLDAREAQRRWNSFLTSTLRPRYQRVIRVLERQKSGRIHYHALISVDADIRTGCDFAAFEQRDYRTAPPALRSEWAFLRRAAKAHGFGRTELLPVRSTVEAIGRYVGKYIGKHLEQRHAADKRVRLVSYTGPKVAITRFAWVSAGSTQWRQKLGAYLWMLHREGAIAAPSMEAMRARYGPRWAYHWRDLIMTLPEESIDEQRDGGSVRGDREARRRVVSPVGRGIRADVADAEAVGDGYGARASERASTWLSGYDDLAGGRQWLGSLSAVGGRSSGGDGTS